MHKLVIACTVGVGGVLIAALPIGWLIMKRPLAVWSWVSRKALKKIGLKQSSAPSPSGPQTFFLGGSGPLLVLLHGAGHQAGTWATVAPALARHFTLIAVDLAGHGDSAPATGPIEASAIVAGLEAVLETQLQGRRATLMGNSLGAWMAMVVAKRHPEWVERVVAVNGGPLKGLEDVNLLPASREEARATMARLRDPSSPPIPDNVLDDLARRDHTSPIVRFAATAATMADWNLDEDQLRTLETPVTLVWGAADGLMPMTYAQRMLDVLPHASLIPVERCGHVPQQESPKRFLAALGKVFPQLAP